MIDFVKLGAPFPPEDIEWRLGSTSKEKMRGMALAYLTARTVMDRLDDVCGPAGWCRRYTHVGGTTVCEIGIEVSPGNWVYKADGAGQSDIEAEKGSLSDAFKRAAVNWKIGRYIYALDPPWVEIEPAGNSFRIKQGAYRELDMILRRATQAIINPVVGPFTGGGLNEARDDIARMQNAGEQKTTELKSSGRLAAELWVSRALGTFQGPGFDLLAYRDWLKTPCTPKGTKANAEKLDELRDKHPDLADKIDEVASDLRVAAESLE